jgi:hypothetical protein
MNALVLLSIFSSSLIGLIAGNPEFGEIGPDGIWRGIEAGDIYICTRRLNSSVNARSGPGPNYRSVLSLPNGMVIERTIDRRPRRYPFKFVRLIRGTDGKTWAAYMLNRRVVWIRRDFICEARSD